MTFDIITSWAFRCLFLKGIYLFGPMSVLGISFLGVFWALVLSAITWFSNSTLKKKKLSIVISLDGYISSFFFFINRNG